jgi:predicted nucleic acid-binding protein
MAAILIDTNVLVYAYDRSEPEKQRRALKVVDGLARAGTGCLSAQVLSEFFVNVTRKIVAPLSVAQAIERIEHYVQFWPVFEVTAQTVLEAVRGTQEHSLSFWDAQIWAAARLNQAGVIFSEDFSPGTVVEGIRFVNPFADNFRAEDWGL